MVEAIRSLRPVSELAARFGVHPVQLAHWNNEARQAELYQQIKRLKMEPEWLKKLPASG